MVPIRNARRARQEAERPLDALALVLIAVALVAVAAGALLYTRGSLAASPRAARVRPIVRTREQSGAKPVDVVVEPVAGNAAPADAGAVAPPAALAARPLEALPDGWREELRRAIGDQDARLARLEERLVDLSQRVDRRLDDVVHDLRVGRDDAARRQAEIDARQEATLERLRADMLARIVARGDQPPLTLARLNDRRLEVTADLYARVARLEASVAAVTNPILLPGEAYVPPAEFLAEAFAWENWKDVGERAFALADIYSAQRLYLSEGTRDELATFVSTLRGVLTRSVYPNLRPDPSPEQLRALRSALESLAEELPRVRGCLEREFMALGGGAKLAERTDPA